MVYEQQDNDKGVWSVHRSKKGAIRALNILFKLHVQLGHKDYKNGINSRLKEVGFIAYYENEDMEVAAIVEKVVRE